MNRYTNISTSQFDPLSMEQIYAVPSAMRQQHDALEASSDELGVYNINRLNVDDPRVSEIIEQEQSGLNDFVDKLNSEGFNRQSRNELRKLAKRKRNLMSPNGELGRAQSAYNAYQANAKELQDMYKKGNISAEKYKLGLQSALSNYKGIVEKDSYNSFTGVADTDYVEKARKIAKDIQAKPQLLEEAGYYLNKDKSMYINRKTGREFTKPGAIADAVANMLIMDQSVMSDLQQREQLGLLGTKGVEGVITDLATTLERDYSIDRKSIDLKLTGNKAYSNDDTNNTGKTPYVLENVGTKKRFDSDVISKLREVEKGGKRTIGGIPRMDASGIGAGAMTQGSPDREEDILISNTLSEETIGITEDLLSRMEDNGVIPINPARTDQEKAKLAADYMERYKDLVFQNPIIKTDAINNKIDSSLMLKTKTKKAAGEFIKDELLGGRYKMWDKETGKLVELKPKEINKVDYIGYIDPMNNIINLEDASSDQMVAPHVVRITDDDGDVKEYYGERGQYERDNQAFVANRTLNKLHSNSIAGPEMADNINMRGEKIVDKRVTGLDFKLNKDMSYDILINGVLDENGDPVILEKQDQEQVKNLIYGLYGVKE